MADHEGDDLTEQAPPAQPQNPFARASVALGLFALLLASFSRLGAALGVAAVVFAGCGVVRAEKTDIGLTASLFGIAIGFVAVLWAVAVFAAR